MNKLKNPGDYLVLADLPSVQLVDYVLEYVPTINIATFAKDVRSDKFKYLGLLAGGNPWLTDDIDYFKGQQRWRLISIDSPVEPSDVLRAGAQHMEDRAATYDKPEGERSMSATVAAFNAIYGHGLTEEEGWQFMTLLKMVRSNQGDFKLDNYEDGAAYFALAAEAGSHERS